MLRMEHFEVHIVSTPADVQSAIGVGLLDSEPVELYCEHCDEIVGEDLDEFYPFAVVLTADDEEWFVCEECFTPTLDPQGS